MYCQCIEFDLKRIYSGMSGGDFEDSMDMLEKSNFGSTLKQLKRLDYSDGKLDLSEHYYDLLNEIREIRNYWCHQCYIDYVYIGDARRRENEFQKLARRLVNENNRLHKIHRRVESIYINEYKK